MSKGCQTSGHSSLTSPNCLAFILHLTAVIQQVHEQSKVPAHHQKQQLNEKRWLFYSLTILCIFYLYTFMGVHIFSDKFQKPSCKIISGSVLNVTVFGKNKTNEKPKRKSKRGPL